MGFVLYLQYFLFVFMAVIGILQIAAIRNDLKGMSFFENKYYAYIFAVITIGGSLFAFFTWNYWSNVGIIEGSQQFGLFVGASFLALVFTLLFASVLKRDLVRVRQIVTHKENLESLKTATLLDIMQNKLKRKE